MANAQTYGNILYNEGVSAVTATPSVELGSRRLEAGVDYVYAYNASTNEQITTGRGAKLASASTGYSADVAVAAPATFSASVLLGVCRNVTMTTGTYGWLATRGFLDVEADGKTSIGAGEYIWLTTSGTFARHTAPTDVSLYAQNWGICGVASTAMVTTTTGSFTVFIKSPLGA